METDFIASMLNTINECLETIRKERRPIVLVACKGSSVKPSCIRRLQRVDRDDEECAKEGSFVTARLRKSLLLLLLVWMLEIKNRRRCGLRLW